MLALMIFVAVMVTGLLLIMYDRYQREKESALNYRLPLFRRKRYHESFELVTAHNRGTPSERVLIDNLLQMGVVPATLYHDLYLNLPGANYSQIDAVLVTEVGVIVFEVKDYSGWIFGNAHQKNWRQILNYGQSTISMLNPIYQNKNHIECLKRRLFWCSDIPFISVIVFYGDCEIKTKINLPPDTYLIYGDEVTETITEIISSRKNVTLKRPHEIIDILQQSVINGKDDSIIDSHIRNIERKYG